MVLVYTRPYICYYSDKKDFTYQDFCTLQDLYKFSIKEGDRYLICIPFNKLDRNILELKEVFCDFEVLKKTDLTEFGYAKTNYNDGYDYFPYSHIHIFTMSPINQSNIWKSYPEDGRARYFVSQNLDKELYICEIGSFRWK